jgi:putative oxidoreductase
MAFILDGFQTHSYAALRIAAGFLFLWHGMSKLFGFPTASAEGVAAHITYIAGPIELVGGTLVMIGLFTQWTALLCSGLMACAYWMAHGLNHPLPLVNHGELAVLYCFVFLAIAAHGAGILSVDAARRA